MINNKRIFKRTTGKENIRPLVSKLLLGSLAILAVGFSAFGLLLIAMWIFL